MLREEDNIIIISDTPPPSPKKPSINEFSDIFKKLTSPIVHPQDEYMEPEFIDINAVTLEDLSNLAIRRKTKETQEKMAAGADSEDVIFVAMYTVPIGNNGETIQDPGPVLDDESDPKQVSEQEVGGPPTRCGSLQEEKGAAQDAGRMLDMALKEVQQNFQSGGRKRRPRLCTPTRKNPKRHVQKILKGEKENDAKTNLVKKSKTKQHSIRIPRTRHQLNVGAIYRLPSPLTARHFRDWPAEGMHERPEYDERTGTLHSFDWMIRKIKEDYDKKFETKNKNEPLEQDLLLLTHETLHHVLACTKTVKKLGNNLDFKTFKINNDKTNDIVDSDKEKMDFLEHFSLKKRDENNCVTPANFNWDELLRDSAALYSIIHNVDEENVIKYIDSVDANDVIQWSYNKFKEN